MSILETIVAKKKLEVAEAMELYPIKLLERSIYFNSPTVSLKKYIRRSDKSGVIAEFKRRSPSKGIINQYASAEKVSIGYMQAGASALSVLTDKEFFGGNHDDLRTARKFNYCPILRKDFIISEYQVIEARSLGADAILLIASVLSPKKIAGLSKLARSLQMEVLVEVHNKQELMEQEASPDIIGVNNRNLNSFETSIENAHKLINLIPRDIVKIAESGISNADTAVMLREAGYDGFLIGEHFMKHSRPEKACAEFIRQLNKAGNEN